LWRSIAAAGILELRTSGVTGESMRESGVDIFHDRDALFRKRSDQRVQGTIVKTIF
jgi:hypothetical protein